MSVDEIAPQQRDGARSRPTVWIIISSTIFSLAIALFVAWFTVIRPETARQPETVNVSRFLSGSANGSTQASTAKVERGKHVANVSFEPMAGTTPVTMAGLIGKPVVLNFWASSCAPCLREMPLFEQLHHEYGDRVTFLGIDTAEGVDAGEAMIARTGVTYAQARDPLGEQVVHFGGVQLPHTVVISADGTVTDIHNRVFAEATELRAAIQRALDDGS